MHRRAIQEWFSPSVFMWFQTWSSGLQACTTSTFTLWILSESSHQPGISSSVTQILLSQTLQIPFYLLPLQHLCLVCCVFSSHLILLEKQTSNLFTNHELHGEDPEIHREVLTPGSSGKWLVMIDQWRFVLQWFSFFIEKKNYTVYFGHDFSLSRVLQDPPCLLIHPTSFLSVYF